MITITAYDYLEHFSGEYAQEEVLPALTKMLEAARNNFDFDNLVEARFKGNLLSGSQLLAQYNC